MSFFSKIKSISRGDLFGVDIGTTAIKAVELSGAKDKGFTLSNYAIMEASGSLERSNGALQSSNLKLLDSDIISYLLMLRQKAGFKSKSAVASLPAFSGFSTLIDLPVSSEREIGQAVQFQAKNYIPLPITTVTLDWLKVGEKVDASGKRTQQVLLISIPNETVELYDDIFSRAGFQLDSLELEQISNARILSLASKTPKLIIDVGGRSTSLGVAKEGNLKFAAQADFSSGSITQAFAQALNISPRRAEDLKRGTSLASAGGETELSTIMLPILDAILSEAKRAQQSFEKAYNERVDGIILTGSTANMKGLPEYVAKQLGLHATKADPFKNIAYPPEIEAVVKDLGPTLSTSLGLALKNA
jgi:type IV pilus assembly protein PilM